MRYQDDKKMNSSCAVCVTYNPDMSVLQQVISAAAGQVGKVYVVDNGSRESFGDFFDQFENAEGIFLNENKGIAAAHNLGIQLARKAGYRYVLLLDQDSILPGGALCRYLDIMNQRQADSSGVAALGPRYRNPDTGHSSLFVRFNWFRNSYHKNERNSLLVDADILISSGSFFDIRIFDEVGLFDEGLFIDHVDTEWCLRAKSSGFRCIGVWDVLMTHSLGEGSLRVWFLRWHVQPLHKPFRLYYIFRNSLLLYRLPHAPSKWVSGDVFRLFRLFIVYSLFSSDRIRALMWMCRGLRDGIQGKRGMAE